MDSGTLTIISIVVGATAALLGSFGGAYVAHKLGEKQSKERRYQDKLEEIQELAIQVKLWIDFELEDWWMQYEHSTKKKRNPLECPIDRLTMLAERYTSSLNQDILAIKDIISSIEGIPLDMFETHATLEWYHDAVIKQYSERYDATYQKVNLFLSQLIRDMQRGYSRFTISS